MTQDVADCTEPEHQAASQPLLAHAFQLTRFAAVGLFGFLLSLGVLTGLHELAGVHYLVAYFAAFIVSSIAGYLLNRSFTFRLRSSGGPGVLRYMLVNVMLVVVNGLALKLLVEYFHMWYLSATILLAVINTPVSFLAHRLLSYRLGWRLAGQHAGRAGH